MECASTPNHTTTECGQQGRRQEPPAPKASFRRSSVKRGQRATSLLPVAPGGQWQRAGRDAVDTVRRRGTRGRDGAGRVSRFGVIMVVAPVGRSLGGSRDSGPGGGRAVRAPRPSRNALNASKMAARIPRRPFAGPAARRVCAGGTPAGASTVMQFRNPIERRPAPGEGLPQITMELHGRRREPDQNGPNRSAAESAPRAFEDTGIEPPDGRAALRQGRPKTTRRRRGAHSPQGEGSHVEQVTRQKQVWN